MNVAVLSSDVLYVQRENNGFKALRFTCSTDNDEKNISPSTDENLSSSEKIQTAINFQKIWKYYGLIIQGLLAGIALLHMIFVRILIDFIFRISEVIVLSLVALYRFKVISMRRRNLSTGILHFQ